MFKQTLKISVVSDYPDGGSRIILEVLLGNRRNWHPLLAIDSKAAVASWDSDVLRAAVGSWVERQLHFCGDGQATLDWEPDDPM